MRALTISQRMSLSMLTFVALAMVFAYFFIAAMSVDIRFTKKEMIGNAHLRTVMPAIEGVVLLQEARQRGDTNIQDAVQKVDLALQDFFNSSQKYADELQLQDESLHIKGLAEISVTSISAIWNNIKQDISSTYTDGDREVYQSLLNALRGVVSYTGDVSNLVTDPEIDSYYMMTSTLFLLPQIEKSLSSIIGSIIEAHIHVDELHHDADLFLISRQALLQEDFDRLFQGIYKSQNMGSHFHEINIDNRRTFDEIISAYKKESINLISLLRKSSLSDNRDNLNAVVAAASKVRQSSSKLWFVSIDMFDGLLEKRIERKYRQLLYILLISVIGLMASFAYFASVRRSVALPIKDREGLYRADSLKDAPKAALLDYFTEKKKEGGHIYYQVSDDLKSLVTFKHLNFREKWPMKGPFDAIFCRNVMIYFDRDLRNSIIRKFSSLLKVGGYLYLGHSENIFGSEEGFSSEGNTIYRKIK